MLGGAAAAMAAAAWPAGASAPTPAAAGGRPNLVLFFLDELRADALACYGNPVTRTPNFDRLAAGGTRFADCHVQNPVCAQSRCSLMTGWPTSVRGHRSLYYLLQPEEPNLFRYLKQAGYEVFFFGKNDMFAAPVFADSVTEWRNAPPTAEMQAIAKAGPLPPAGGPLTMRFAWGGDRRSSADYALVQYAIKVLEQRERDRPFCIFLPLVNPHPPYMAPEGFDRLYDPARLPPLVPPGLPKKPSHVAALRESYHLDKVDDLELRRVRATYYGQVSYADWLLGEFLEAIERTGHAGDTVVAVASDHGDYAGDYGLIEKWPNGLESCLTHVPLIIRAPGGAPGHTVGEMVELYDIMATFLELGGAQATHTHFARSLVPQLHGAPGDPARAAFVEGGYNVYEPQAFEPRMTGLYARKTALQNDRPDCVQRAAAVKTSDFAFVERPGGQSELYDRRSDPGETRNLIDSAGHAEVRARLQRRLLDWYVNTSGVPATNKDARDTPPFYPTARFPEGDKQKARILDR